MPQSKFEQQYFEDPEFAPGLKGGDEVRGYGYYPDYFPIIEAQIATLIELTQARTLVDAGCGKGALAEYVRSELGVATVGTDLSSYAVQAARAHHGGKLTVQSAVTALPFKDDAFEACWSNGVLQYLEAGAARRALAEIFRVTQKAAFVSNIAAAQRYTEWGNHDHLTQLYLSPAQWESLARSCGANAVALPFEGESAVLLVKNASRMLPLRFVEQSLERMARLGCLRRKPAGLAGFRRRFE